MKEPLIQQLQQRFVATWDAQAIVTVSQGHTMDVWQRLDELYSEHNRRYHTWRHINHCLNQLDSVKHLLEWPEAVELAIWFHDAIYLCGARDNERESADLFMRYSESLFSDALRNQVVALITTTEHRQLPASSDHAFIADIDLSGIGLDWDEFYADCQRLREEQPDLCDDTFNKNQSAFLSTLLAREWIYSTEHYRNGFETQARNNIKHRLAMTAVR